MTTDGGTFFWKPLGATSEPVEFVEIGWASEDGLHRYHQQPGIALDFTLADVSQSAWERALQGLRGGTITMTFRLEPWHFHIFGLGRPPTRRYIRHLRTRRPQATGLRYRAWRCTRGS